MITVNQDNYILNGEANICTDTSISSEAVWNNKQIQTLGKQGWQHP